MFVVVWPKCKPILKFGFWTENHSEATNYAVGSTSCSCSSNGGHMCRLSLYLTCVNIQRKRQTDSLSSAVIFPRTERDVASIKLLRRTDKVSSDLERRQKYPGRQFALPVLWCGARLCLALKAIKSTASLSLESNRSTSVCCQGSRSPSSSVSLSSVCQQWPCFLSLTASRSTFLRHGIPDFRSLCATVPCIDSIHPSSKPHDWN